MLSKNKTFLALTVKLLFSVTLLQAQAKTDSARQNITHIVPVYSNASLVQPQKFQNGLPANFYAKQLPFFCSKELKVQKAVGIPIKFRLSTVEYCDRLEGKNR
jgi:hypothetical protein